MLLESKHSILSANSELGIYVCSFSPVLYAIVSPFGTSIPPDAVPWQ